MSRDEPRYATFAQEFPWAITPTMLPIIARVIAHGIVGERQDPVTIAAAKAARREPQPARGGVAVIPIHGVLAPRGNMFHEVSGVTSFDQVHKALRGAVRHPDVKNIVLDIDSPGGSVAGATELAGVIREARTHKPIIAHGQFQIGSAAYWLASQAAKIYLSPSAQAGSIGVYTLHDDLSEALAKLGVKREYIAAGKYKVEGNETHALSDDAKAYITSVVEASYDQFIADIARGRGVSAATVRNGYGEGRMLTAAAALAAGLADQIATFEETLDRLLPAGTSAEDMAALSGACDTSQEPARATDQDRAPDAAWQAQIERDLFALQL
jgi:signal peptide peptidase SppA